MDRKTLLVEWIKDLRSGKFEQKKGRLAGIGSYGGVKYCCLGVLCETYIRLGGTLVKNKTGAGYNYDNEHAGIPTVIRDVLQIEEKAYNTLDEQSVIDWNDAKNFSFDQIADGVEIDAKQRGWI